MIGLRGAVGGVAVRLDGPAALVRLPARRRATSWRRRCWRRPPRSTWPPSITAPLLGAAFRAPLNGAEYADLAVFLAGPTGVLKSELAALAQRFFGVAFDRLLLPASWAATANALERVGFDFKDALCAIDDFAPAGSAVDAPLPRHRRAGVPRRRQRGRPGRMNADGTLRRSTVRAP